MFQPEAYTDRQLIQCYVDILDELRRRQIVRTANVTGDITESLVAQKLGLVLSRNSTAGYDATDGGTRYQIKARRVHPTDRWPELSVMRDLGEQRFDYLVAVIFSHGFDVQRAVKIPHGVVVEYAIYKPHVKGHVLYMRRPVLSDTRVEDLTSLFQPEA